MSKVFENNSAKCKATALLIMPRFFGYEELISRELNKHYAKVFLVYENLEEFSMLSRRAKSTHSGLWHIITHNHYQKAISEIDDAVKQVLIIRGSSLDEPLMLALRKAFPDAKFTVYQWDGAENVPNSTMLAEYCDLASSFDPSDSIKYGWKYRPLFYVDDSICEKTIDISFLGSLHSKRSEIQNLLNVQADSDGLNVYTFLYTKPLIYFKNRWITPKDEFKSLSGISDVRFTPLSLSNTQRILAKTKVVVDFGHPNQTGFTLRTIECMAHGCKLVTNNQAIAFADFYNSDNISIYDGPFPGIDKCFLEGPYSAVPSSIKSRYSISSWLTDLLVAV